MHVPIGRYGVQAVPKTRHSHGLIAPIRTSPHWHAFVVESWQIHRIQETHTLLLHLLWDEVHVALGETDVL